jgi:hypothetical protein
MAVTTKIETKIKSEAEAAKRGKGKCKGSALPTSSENFKAEVKDVSTETKIGNSNGTVKRNGTDNINGGGSRAGGIEMEIGR